MKKLILLITLIGISSINLIAQQISFTFNPKDPTNKIDSIRAVNISTNKTAFVSGSNVINLNSLTTVINDIKSKSGNFNVFPNPFDHRTELQFYTEQDDDITVFLTNSLGQMVAKSNQYVASGAHNFEISINSEGLHIINVVGNQIKFSQKIIAFGNHKNPNKIEYQGIKSHSKIEKSENIDAGVIHFTIYSGEKITNIADAPKESKTYNVEFIECKDIDGRSYPIVQIGEQWWMAENLSVNIENESWTYNNIAYNAKIYGRLYSFNTANKNCPDGWHLPTDSEWLTLSEFISTKKGPYGRTGEGIWEVVGKHLKSSGSVEDEDGLWQKDATWLLGVDDFGFSGYPSGYVYKNNFAGAHKECWWWGATFTNSKTDAFAWGLKYGSAEIFKSQKSFNFGLSVRCVKNDKETNFPSISTSEISNITHSEATAGGIILTDGGAEITAYGIVWNSTGNPRLENCIGFTVANEKTDGFISLIKNLNDTTSYYVKAYATNYNGTTYGSQKSFSTLEHPDLVKDYDGNVYAKIRIGKQIWMGKNLEVKHYNNGDSILTTIFGLDISNEDTPKYYWNENSVDTSFFSQVISLFQIIINGGARSLTLRQMESLGYITSLQKKQIADKIGIDESSSKTAFQIQSAYKIAATTAKKTGAYYTWYSINDERKICPKGWHIPTDDDWKTLENYLGGASVAGGKLKSINGWISPNSGAINLYNFTGLPSGERRPNGTFTAIGTKGNWWSINETSVSNVWSKQLNYDNTLLYPLEYQKNYGLSVRCIKD